MSLPLSNISFLFDDTFLPLDHRKSLNLSLLIVLLEKYLFSALLG